MSDETPKQKAKVVSMCGRPVEPGPGEGEDGHDPEAAAARRQLTHWAATSTRYVGLFLSDDGIAFASSSEDPGVILSMVTLLKQRADAFAVAALCDEYDLEPDDDDDD